MRLNFKVDYPEKLKRFLANPTPYVNETMKAADRLVLILLQESIKTNIWHNKTRELKDSIEIRVSEGIVFTNKVYAPAVEKGHYAEPLGIKKFLHFKDEQGKDVFLKFTRSKKKPFFFKAISQNKVQIEEIYDDAFKKLMERI